MVRPRKERNHARQSTARCTKTGDVKLPAFFAQYIELKRAERNMRKPIFEKRSGMSQAYMLNTKVGRYEQEVDKMFDFTAERVTRSVDESLERLGLEYIDCIQVGTFYKSKTDWTVFLPRMLVIKYEFIPHETCVYALYHDFMKDT